MHVWMGIFVCMYVSLSLWEIAVDTSPISFCTSPVICADDPSEPDGPSKLFSKARWPAFSLLWSDLSINIALLKPKYISLVKALSAVVPVSCS